MKKIILTLAFAGFAFTTTLAPAYACEGGKCTKEHAQQNSAKTKKGKKAVKEESCHMASSSSEKGKSCCMKKEETKTEASKAAKETKAQR
ncbi:hypothetical protein ACSX1A_06955 [Pontibacter sp. MBLB2868]|uniref:hypothetical protein n=1 Tax=Pontibacter sp. MBLB2868 TaxID=3451555 RepID=UPI003F74D44F